MKIKSLIVSMAFLMAMLVPAVAYADAAGQIETGDFYYGKNDTKNSAYGDPVLAGPCEVITLKMRLHNPGPSALHNVNVKATVPSGTGTSFSSVATVSAADGDPQVVTDSVAIKLSKSLKISYVPGSSQLLDAHSGVIKTLADGAIQSGVNIGDVGVSIEQKRFVQFKLKTDCPKPPVTPPETPPTTPPTVTTVTSLPNTGPGSVAAIFAVVTAASSIAYYAVSRRLSRQ